MDFSWTEEQEIWRGVVRDFVQKKIKSQVREVDSNKKIPKDIIKDMEHLGLLIPTASKENGVATSPSNFLIRESACWMKKSV